MEKFYKRVKYCTIAIWGLVAMVVLGLTFTDISMFFVTVVAILLGLILTLLVTLVLVKLENNKLYVNKETKKKVLGLNRSVDYSSNFTFVNVLDMLCNDATNTKIVKLIVSNYENGKEKSRDTYYVDQSDDRMNEMVNAICDYKKAKLYSFEEVENEIMKSRKNKIKRIHLVKKMYPLFCYSFAFFLYLYSAMQIEISEKTCAKTAVVPMMMS